MRKKGKQKQKKHSPSIVPAKKEFRMNPDDIKHLLHSLWFSQRKEEGLVEHEKENERQIKTLSKEMTSYEGQIEQQLKMIEQEANTKLESIDKSLNMLKEMVLELRRENENIRQDRQFLFQKLMNMMVRSEEPATNQMNSTNVEEFVPIQGTPTQKQKSSPQQSSGDHVKTSLDGLLELVMEQDSMKISDAAKKLHVSEKEIEEWAHILEDHDLIEIHYPTFGKPVLKKKK